ncbi:MAG: helix-turn-helix domain-containing protein [Lachnospiraceae bacterium]|nr:helix-turn-helix domain-containing protein [Lachnospiraceae bacterium]
MEFTFGENLRKLREKKGLSQKQLGKQMFVNPSTIANWECGRRLPDAVMVLRLAKCLGVDANTLLQLVAQSEKNPNVIMVDDSEIILTGGMSVLSDVLPNATIAGFIWPTEAIEYAKINRIDLAILDIELGTSSGFDLCSELLKIYPFTNILFLTAFIDYSYDAWKTEASGFILKPLTHEGIKEQLRKLRYPFCVGGSDK